MGHRSGVTAALSTLPLSSLAAAGICEMPDNGGGTATMPPFNCAYESPQEVFMIIDAPGHILVFQARRRIAIQPDFTVARGSRWQAVVRCSASGRFPPDQGP